MSVTDTLLSAIKYEIDNDPMNVGYDGKSDEEITDLLNNPQYVTVETQVLQPARINQILIGIADTPNAIESSDVVASQDAKVVAVSATGVRDSGLVTADATPIK